MTILFKRLIFTLYLFPFNRSINHLNIHFSSSAVISSGDNAKLSATVGQPFSTKMNPNNILNSDLGSVAMVMLDR